MPRPAPPRPAVPGRAGPRLAPPNLPGRARITARARAPSEFSLEPAQAPLGDRAAWKREPWVIILFHGLMSEAHRMAHIDAVRISRRRGFTGRCFIARALGGGPAFWMVRVRLFEHAPAPIKPWNARRDLRICHARSESDSSRHWPSSVPRASRHAGFLPSSRIMRSAASKSCNVETSTVRGSPLQ
jgi:hypothetical protein